MNTIGNTRAALLALAALALAASQGLADILIPVELDGLGRLREHVARGHRQASVRLVQDGAVLPDDADRLRRAVHRRAQEERHVGGRSTGENVGDVALVIHAECGWDETLAIAAANAEVGIHGDANRHARDCTDLCSFWAGMNTIGPP